MKTLLPALASAALLLSTACVAPQNAAADPSTKSLSEEIDPMTAPWRGGQEAFLAACEDWDEWDKPAPPFQIIGNTFHVGTCGISAILVVGPEGHILIDSGTEGGVKVVLDNIRKLGFDPADVKYIATSHEHHDHVGGHAAFVRATGATVVSSEAGAEVLRRGQVGPDDPQSGVHEAMEPVAVGLVLQDGETLKLGELELTAHATPGHTPGALSWTWWGCSLPGEPPVCRRVAYVDSLSPVSADDYRFSDHPAYVAQFRQSFAEVAALPCDILLTPHPSSSAMLSRMRDGALDDQAACAAYARAGEKRLDARLAKEGEGS
ncbi:subclass B3 metallo-beta-lactamase [Paraurantiacibacter namhicola]|uniref:Metallo-beta-lactamase L1 n=1 Tax=Paraurantiacibacter namhicola TaxID=645517 RepID=A0A1C7D8K3_9SPHN|nr:subclass B3 metallo-beta-lactamase [Paraurantiacibacter namhicola]ANU07809.1 Metallo-beta-lactamase L1 precursor [Paraurantiacibacter namhicola]